MVTHGHMTLMHVQFVHSWWPRGQKAQSTLTVHKLVTQCYVCRCMIPNVFIISLGTTAAMKGELKRKTASTAATTTISSNPSMSTRQCRVCPCHRNTTDISQNRNRWVMLQFRVETATSHRHSSRRNNCKYFLEGNSFLISLARLFPSIMSIVYRSDILGNVGHSPTVE